MAEGAARGAGEGNHFYARLWELNLKLEEVARAFTKEDLGGEDVDREFAEVMAGLELAYSKVVELVRVKRGLPNVVPVNFNPDVQWILGVEGAKEPEEVRRLR